MATSTLKLYHISNLASWKLLPEKCFLIEDISSYLTTFENAQNCTTISNFQYIKNQLEIEIKVDLSERYSAPLNAIGTGFNYPAIKYVSITNSDEQHTYYYFVKKVEWRSTMTCKLNLVMDVLNSVQINHDYILNKKCHITRQHKNRLLKKRLYINYRLSNVGGVGQNIENWDTNDNWGFEITTGTHAGFTTSVKAHDVIRTDTGVIVEFEIQNNIDKQEFVQSSVELTYLTNTCEGTIEEIYSSYKYLRKIDLLSEGFNAPLYVNSESNMIVDYDSHDWYLIYATKLASEEQEDNPLYCFLCCEDNIDVAPNQPAITGRIYPEMLTSGRYYYNNDVAIQDITLADGTIIHSTYKAKICFYKVGNEIIVSAGHYDIDTNLLLTIRDYHSSYISITSNITMSYKSSYDMTPYDISLPEGTQTFYAGDYPTTTLDKIDDLDRTNSKIVKVIKLPYAPFMPEYSEGVLDIPSEWEYSEFDGFKCLKLISLSSKFNYTFEIETNPLAPISEIVSFPNYQATRNDFYESKIFHSDFYTPKMVYDSFSFIFQLEKFDPSYYNYDGMAQDKFKIQYTCTTTINSRFMFMFPQYITNHGSQDYDNVMPIARNNEIALYNIPYLNYIRSGFNYDVKSKQRSEATTWLGTGLQALAMGATLMFPANPLKIPMVVGMATSFISSLTSSINTTLQSEQNIQSKLEQLKWQSASVSGSDDVDLMSVYTGNKAKMNIYKVSSQMESLLLDLFYYTGYNENIMGIPQINTRKWFNFIACDLELTFTWPNIPEEIKNELTSLYKNGITIMHKNVISGVNTWDLAQTMENAESNIEEL